MERVAPIVLPLRAMSSLPRRRRRAAHASTLQTFQPRTRGRFDL